MKPVWTIIVCRAVMRKQEISETAFGAASTETIESDLRDDAEIVSQSIAFEQHLELAATKSKNVVIHQRDAWADTLKILRPYSGRLQGVFHCFNGSLEQAQEAIELGHYISFTGIVTFKNAADLRQTAASLPSDRIMVETDAPYLAPGPLSRQTLRTCVRAGNRQLQSRRFAT